MKKKITTKYIFTVRDAKHYPLIKKQHMKTLFFRWVFIFRNWPQVNQTDSELKIDCRNWSDYRSHLLWMNKRVYVFARLISILNLLWWSKEQTNYILYRNIWLDVEVSLHVIGKWWLNLTEHSCFNAIGVVLYLIPNGFWCFLPLGTL
jgi:hypothetical protein